MVIEADRRLESDATLVAETANGDQSAYKALYERHHAHLLAVLKASIPAPLAEEAAQEAWARAYERIQTLDKPQSFFSWLSTIARNYARDHHRSTSPESLGLFDEHEWIPEPSPGPDTVVEQDEDRRLAAQALQRLPEKQRAALLLRNLQGRSYLSIAGRLGLSISATETLLHRARSNFQREYSSLQTGDDAPALACYKMRASLRALSTGALSDLRRMRVIAHLESCEPCRLTQEEMRRTRKIAGFIPFFLPVAWLRDKLLYLGKALADGAAKVTATMGAGAGSLGATPLAIISGGLAAATISGAVFLGATVFDPPFFSSDNDRPSSSQSTGDAISDNQGRPQPRAAATPAAGTISEVGDLAGGDVRPTALDGGQGDVPPPPADQAQDSTTDPLPVNGGTPAGGCQVEPCSPPGGCESDCGPPPPPPDPCVADPNAVGCQPPDPCEANPQAPGCTPDPCVSNPNAEGCGGGDPCATNPNAEGCGGGDPCATNPNAEGCGGEDPCVLNPSGPGCDDRNNGHGNDSGGRDPTNPGNGAGSGNSNSNQNSDGQNENSKKKSQSN